MATPVVFVHGLWLHSTSWQPWMELFTERGYTPVAPEWPGTPDTVEEARADSSAAANRGVTEITDHFAHVIAGLTTKPVLVGHSFGGLIVQKLLGRGLGLAAVAVDPAPMKGVLALPASALRVASVAVANPANRKRTVALNLAQFRYGFGNAIPEAESQELFEKWTIPSPGRPLFEAAFANFSTGRATAVDTSNANRGPLLLVSGGQDHTVPPALVRGARHRYEKSPAITEMKTFADRGHSISIDHGWREVAETSLAWLTAQDL